MEASLDLPDIGYFWAAVLGLIQGLTEFLPVSSSGHLALAEHLGLGREAPPSLDAFLHLATLAVVCRFFFRSILWYAKNDRRVLWFAAMATLPTALIGLAGKKHFEALRQSPTLICVGLLVTASALAAAEMRRPAAGRLRDLGWFGAFAIGLAQSLALAPGISRSGLTLSSALLCGAERGEAFRFSFIISIPAILGAVGLHALEILRHDGLGGLTRGAGIGPLLLGMAVAAVSGKFALSLLERLIAGGRLVWFAGYCCLAALAGLIYFHLY